MTLYAFLPLVLGLVLVSSAITKLRTPSSVNEWAGLGVPRWLLRRWLVRSHPWAEIALGLGAMLLGGMFGRIVTGAAAALMIIYTVLIWAGWRRGDADCACFGAARPVTRVQVIRNLWLAAVAIGATLVVGSTPAAGGALATLSDTWDTVLAGAIAAITVALILWSERPRAEELAPPAPAEEMDYVRTRTPNVPVTLADGSETTLRQLTSTRPLLLLAVNGGCSPCVATLERVPVFRGLLPEVDVRLLLTDSPKASRITEHAEPQSLHDPHRYVRGSIADWAVPTAVLFGVDGMLAGGPVTGVDAIEEFVHDIYFELNGTYALSHH